jgi:isoquinoline 1-oxidoreductase subunit alpha
MITLTINGTPMKVDLPPETPLLWALRDGLNLTGTKYGCGVAACGACTVMMNGQAVRSCQTAIADVSGPITTIEAQPVAALTKAWIQHQVAQCGYCQSGQIMQAAALLTANPKPTDDEIFAAMDGNLCRCGTYPRILAAIRTASAGLEG